MWTSSGEHKEFVEVTVADHSFSFYQICWLAAHLGQ